MDRRLIHALASAVLCAVPLAAQNSGIALTTGADGGVEFAYDPRMVPPTGLTVEAWITYDDTTIPTGLNYWPTIARQNISPNQESWNFRVDAATTGNRALKFAVRTATNALYGATYIFQPAEFANWTHVAGTYDGTTIRVIVNGVQVASFIPPVVSEIQDNGGILRLGNGDPAAPGNEVWNGSIDEVRIWPMARTPGEIAASMNQELQGMPGSLLVLPLNGNYTSEDLSLTGVPFGAVGFVAGEPNILPITPIAFVIGQDSSTCARVPELLAGSVASVGNLDFTLWCVRGPTPPNSPVGAIFAAGGYTAGLPPVLGITLNIDPNLLIVSALQSPATDAIGNANFVLSIPNQPTLVGASWVFQWVFLDPVCGALDLTASNGLLIAIQ